MLELKYEWNCALSNTVLCVLDTIGFGFLRLVRIISRENIFHHIIWALFSNKEMILCEKKSLSVEINTGLRVNMWFWKKKTCIFEHRTQCIKNYIVNDRQSFCVFFWKAHYYRIWICSQIEDDAFEAYRIEFEWFCLYWIDPCYFEWVWNVRPTSGMR